MNNWHHVAYQYPRGAIACWVDGQRVADPVAAEKKYVLTK